MRDTKIMPHKKITKGLIWKVYTIFKEFSFLYLKTFNIILVAYPGVYAADWFLFLEDKKIMFSGASTAAVFSF